MGLRRRKKPFLPRERRKEGKILVCRQNASQRKKGERPCLGTGACTPVLLLDEKGPRQPTPRSGRGKKKLVGMGGGQGPKNERSIPGKRPAFHLGEKKKGNLCDQGWGGGPIVWGLGRGGKKEPVTSFCQWGGTSEQGGRGPPAGVQKSPHQLQLKSPALSEGKGEKRGKRVFRSRRKTFPCGREKPSCVLSIGKGKGRGKGGKLLGSKELGGNRSLP